MQAHVPDEIPAGTLAATEPDGSTTLVPDSRGTAAEFNNILLVPGKRGEIPNGPAAFAVHHTPTQDLRWFTRVAAQRTSGYAPIRGPADVPFFVQRGFGFSTGKLAKADEEGE